MADRTGKSAETGGAVRDGSRDELFAAIYQELRLIARSRLRRYRRGTMLDTTALVHEAYLKLADSDGKLDSFDNRRHFFATAALAMRQILTDQARRRLAHKRGGHQRNLTLNEDAVAEESSSIDVLQLDSALTNLQELDATLAEVVNLKYFGGLSLEDIAHLQGTSTRTVSRNWQKARAFLHAQMTD